MVSDVMFSDIRADYETPDALYQMLNNIYEFTLDAAADRKNAKCAKFYTKKDNALVKPWTGSVWCNPPYGKVIEKWVEHANSESIIGNATSIVMLLPARTDTKWFAELCNMQVCIMFVQGRLKFKHTDNTAPFPSMLATWGNIFYHRWRRSDCTCVIGAFSHISCSPAIRGY